MAQAPPVPHRPRHRLPATIAASLALLPALDAAAAAQPVATDSARREPSGAGEDQEIFVTARGRVEEIDSTPVAISSFGPEEMDARSAVAVADLVNAVPNAMFDSTAPLSGSANSASIFIRGVGQSDFVFATDPGVAVYLDGVYIARSTGAALDLLDVEQVQVLRGPQGTLFGRNAIGGAVTVTSNAPDPGEASTEFEATLGSFSRFEMRGIANMPLAGGVALWLAAGYRRADGYGRRLIDGASLGGEEAVQLRGALRWQASPELSFGLAADYTRRDDESPVQSLTGVGGDDAIGAPTTLFTGLLYNNLIEDEAGVALCERPNAPVPFCGLPGIIAMPTLPAGTVPFDARWLTRDPFTTFATGPTGSEFEGFGITATAEYGTRVVLTSISAYRQFDAAFGRDPDSSPQVIVDTANLLDHEQFSQELRLGDDDGAFEWVAGLYAFGENGSDRGAAPFIDETFRIVNRLGLGCTLLPGATGLPVPLFLSPCPNIFRIDFAGDGVRVENRSLAAFGEGTFHMNDWLSVSGGLRWTRDRKMIDVSGFLVGGMPVAPDPVARRSFSRFTPRLTVEAALPSDMFAYASWSTGFKSGGFNQRYGAPIAAPTSFEPEKVRSFELGLRMRPRGRRPGLRLTGFWADYDDIQLVVFDTGIPRTINAAAGRTRGIEIEGQWQPVPGLTLAGSYGWLDAGFTRLDPAIIGESGLPVVNPVQLDDRFVNSPRHSIALSAEYLDNDVADLGELLMRLDVSHRSSVANDAVNTAELVQGPVTLINARLEVRPEGQPWSIALFGTNLLDELYIVSGAADPAGFGAAEFNVAHERRWGVSIELGW